MKLIELQPQFYRYDIRIEDYQVVDGVWDADKADYLCSDGKYWKDHVDPRPTKTITGPRTYLSHVDGLADAQGIMFLCPKCYLDNKSEIGTHHVHMPFADRGHTEKNMWHVSGTGYNDLSTTPSYLIVGGCNWHGYITNGDVSII